MKINIPELTPFIPVLMSTLSETTTKTNRGEVVKKEIYLVGGAIRDTINKNQKSNIKYQTALAKKKQTNTKNKQKTQKLQVEDFDFAINASAISFAKRFAKKINGSFVILDKDIDEVRVVYKNGHNELIFDFCSITSINTDLSRRDFTINAIAAKLPDMEVLDIFKGEKDIHQKTIRMISEQNIKDDPLRILRAFRLKSTMDFNISPKTTPKLIKHRKLLKNIAGERIKQELFSILNSPKAYETLRFMAKKEILQVIIPELKKLMITPQYKPTGNLLDHSLLTVKKIDTATYNFKKYTANKIHILKFSGLLHDIGKPYTYSKDKLNRVHFYGHEKRGVELLEGIRGRLKLSNSDFRSLSNLIGFHMRPHLLGEEKIPTNKAILRFIRDGEEDSILILLLAYADAMASGNRGRAGLLRLINRSIEIWETMRQPKFKRLLTGNDLIKMGYKPGPVFKTILQAIEEEQISNELSTRKQAMDFVIKNWRQK
ncbi:MAG: HD domain-containing protein [bacterium]|nr:HD domain-containing protein [bacterium]